jgi:hypothetical protein
VVDSSEEESEESEDDYEDEEDVKPKKKGNTKPPPKAKPPPKKPPQQPATKAAAKGKAKEENVELPAKPFKYAYFCVRASFSELRDLAGLLQKPQNWLDRPPLVRNKSLNQNHVTVSRG